MNLTRRQLGVASAALLATTATVRAQTFAREPFTLGVSSSLPRPNAVTLWTRLAPEPLEPEGGLPPIAIPVRWELAADEAFAMPVASGVATARPELAHSVRVTVDGLEADRRYWFRFMSGSAVSRVGRTKTLPDPALAARRVRFATASCQHYEQGYFAAYDHMIADDPDFVLHLGDFIYGVSRGSFRSHSRKAVPITLADYRVRHALYATDESLQRARAMLPFQTVLDNHDAVPFLLGTPAALAQRSAAYQAWFEHMPMEGGYTPGGTALFSHAGFDFGDLLRLTVLDTRQFRDPENLCREKADKDFAFTIYRPLCEPVLEAQRTMLGVQQEAWLSRRMRESKAKWNAVSSTVLFSPFSMPHRGEDFRYEASWDYYPDNRKRVLADMAQTSNSVVLSADVHSNWAVDINADPANPASQTVGTEFLATSINSEWPAPLDRPMAAALTHNPHVKHYNGAERGYMLHDVTHERWQTDMRVIDDTKKLQPTVKSQARFAVEAGKPGAQRA